MRWRTHKRRTFLDYRQEFASPTEFGFDLATYGTSFLDWCDVHGYIETNFSHSVQVFTNQILTVPRGLFKSYDEAALIDSAKRIKQQISKIEAIGQKSNSTDQLICEAFVKILFEPLPEAEQKVKLQPASKNQVLTLFKNTLAHYFKLHHPTAPLMMDYYMEDLESFLEHIPRSAQSEQVQFFLSHNMMHYWKDVGVVVYFKTETARNLLFYEFGDDA